MPFIDRFHSEEARARDPGLVEAQLLVWRQQKIAPIAAEFQTWSNAHLTGLLPCNPVRKAMQCYINDWDALTRFLHAPAVELYNSWAERPLRKVCLVRNNSLYAEGEEGAVRLCTLLTRVVPHRDNRGLVAADLMPSAYKAAQQTGAQ